MSHHVVQLAPAAEADIREVFIWYRERNALIADGFRAEVFDAIDRISDAPLTNGADEDGNRKRVLRRFPYSVVCEVQENMVTVLAVAHHRRKPGYWTTAKA